jgi:hypothetical protein
MHSWRPTIVVAALLAFLVAGPGCASEPYVSAPDDEITSIERPARPLEEEETFSDKLGEVGVVVLAVGGVIAGMLAPLLLF